MKPPKFSDAYARALAEATAHHANSKTYSGKFLRPHAPWIKALIQTTGASSVLDYGCGKGAQYAWVSHGEDASIPKGLTIGDYWDVPVFKYDPAWPPFATDPEERGPFGVVICTHTLGSIPLQDLPLVINRLGDLASDAVYIAEKLGPVGKQVFSDDATGFARFDRDGWVQVVKAAAARYPNLTWHLALRHQRDPVAGVIVERFEWVRGRASGGTVRT